jgi:uncharacterized protein involved in outer membrane biogenesis
VKKVLIAAVVIVVLAVGALLVVPSFWDWNGEKGRIANLVKEHTGRDLTIAGDVSLSLLPAPAFSAADVTLANIEGGSESDMVRLEELQVRVALMPLLGGSVLVESVTLVKPDVLLEVLPDGRNNWTFATAPEPATPQSGGGGVAPGDGGTSQSTGDTIRVDSFIIEEGTVRYLDAQSGRHDVVENLNAELGAESLIGPFAARGAATYGGVPLEFDFSLDRLVEGGATALSLSLTLPEAAASGQFFGAISRHETLRTLRGRLQAEGEDLAGLLRSLPMVGAADDLPAPLAQRFTLSAELAGSDSEVTAEPLTMTLGGSSFSGKLSARLAEIPDVTAELTTKSLDLDKLLAPQAAGAAAPETGQSDPAPPAAAPESSEAPAEPAGSDGFSLPDGLTATVKVSADALLYRQQTVRQFSAAGRLAGGQLTLDQVTAQLPGSSEFSLSGTLQAADRSPGFKGQLSAESDNFRGLLQWLGVDLAAVPAERLRRLRLETALEASPSRVTLRGTDLQVDVSRLTGGVAVALRDRPGLGIGVQIDKVNLDAYLPKESAKAAGQGATSGGNQGQGSQTQENPTQGQAATEGQTGGFPLLGRFDANFDVKVGQLTYLGVPIGGLRLDATLQRGGVVVREISVADLAGSRGQFAGSLSNVDRDPSIDGSLDLSVAALSRLTKVFGLQDIGPLPLESFTLSGAVNGNRDQLRFDQRLSALNGTLKAAGKADLQAGLPGIDAALELDHPNLSVLLGELLRDASVPKGLGPLALEGQLSTSQGSVKLARLTGKVAGVDLVTGDLDLALDGARPKVTAELTTGVLPLGALGAPAAGGKKAKSGNAGGGASNSAGRAPGGARWSTKPIDLTGLNAFDAEVKLHAKALVADKLRLSNAEVEARLEGGLLTVKRFDAETYGGKVALQGTADARSTARDGLEVAATFSATNIEIKKLLQDMAETDRFSGPMSLSGDLKSRGGSEAALVSALNGRGQLEGTVTVAAKAEEQGAAMLLGVLGQKVKEVRGLTDATTMLFSAFAGAPSRVEGTYVVDQGVVRTDDLTVRGRNARALTAGNANLPTWHLESRTDVYRDADPQTPYLTAVLRGPLDSPDVNLNGQPFQRREEPAAVEIPTDEPTPLQPKQQQQQRQPAQQPKPEDLLKDGLKSLLKGLGG